MISIIPKADPMPLPAGSEVESDSGSDATAVGRARGGGGRIAPPPPGPGARDPAAKLAPEPGPLSSVCGAYTRRFQALGRSVGAFSEEGFRG